MCQYMVLDAFLKFRKQSQNTSSVSIPLSLNSIFLSGPVIFVLASLSAVVLSVFCCFYLSHSLSCSVTESLVSVFIWDGNVVSHPRTWSPNYWNSHSASCPLHHHSFPSCFIYCSSSPSHLFSCFHPLYMPLQKVFLLKRKGSRIKMKQSGQASISKVVYIPNERESVKLRVCACVYEWLTFGQRTASWLVSYVW